MALSQEQLIRYSRNIPLEGFGREGQEKLLESKVLVIGAGAVGSAALLYLASAGIGELGISDGDRVELSNLQRQIIHTMTDVGREKNRSAERKLRERNPEIRIRPLPDMTAGNIEETVKQYDFILDCTDSFAVKFLINDACVLAEKPYCHSGVLRYGGQVMTYVPGQGPCLRCVLKDVPEGQDTSETAGVLGAAAGVIGSLEAAECVRYLLDTGRLLTGRILSFDGFDMTFREIQVPDPDPACPVCGPDAVIRAPGEDGRTTS
ncbi:MAG: HesA/MoeB/ThiF family protein [Oscillospiraceae bacterium]|nr:HesA/MoeB/ThiF family protein [Oscillospiraceae bacterium]